MNKAVNWNKTASRIRSLRREKRMSQLYLAEKLGVSRSLVSAWENGSCTPDINKIRVMTMLFGVPADYIYGSTDRRYNIKIPNGFEFDLTKLNSAGIQMIHSIYKLLINSDEYRQK